MITNELKKLAITDAVYKHDHDRTYANEFLEYFSSNNGIPRHLKIQKFYNIKMSRKIQDSYEARLSDLWKEVELLPGVKDFLIQLQNKARLFILSGGERNEIELLLSMYGLSKYFNGIFCSPNNKSVNIDRMKLNSPIFFGDSKTDYLVSKERGVEFIFVSGASEESDRAYFEQHGVSTSIEDFTRINYKC